jgi:hypothetical protein
LAKVQQAAASRDLLFPITLYASDDASAEAMVRAMPEVALEDGVVVKAIRAFHEPYFHRAWDDQRGCVQHFNIEWSKQGPFTTIDLFET